MSYTVLVVDDSSIIRYMVKRSITMADLEVASFHEAVDGFEALAVLSRTSVDVMFLDLNMPGMGGVELVEKMARDNLLSKIAVIVFSAEHNPERVEMLLKLGVRAYLKKPFRPEGVREVIRTVLLRGDP